MKITVVTLFPEMFTGFLHESIVKRAQEKGLVEIEYIQLRDFAVDKHNSVDERPYGGAAGMVLMVEPVKKALAHIALGASDNGKSHIVLTSARGRNYNQSIAEEYAKLDHIIVIAGHYEAFDERISDYIDEEISVGDYVLTGGELPAAVIIDSVIRLLPGVLKKEQATDEESFSKVPLNELIQAVGLTEELKVLQDKGVSDIRLLEYPHYTRPETFDGKTVPDILLSGNHAAIRTWQLQQAYDITKKRRPDLLS